MKKNKKNNDINLENDNKVNVYVTQASAFSVKIPKTIILSAETKQTEYQIVVDGDIGGLDSVSVKSDNLIIMIL